MTVIQHQEAVMALLSAAVTPFSALDEPAGPGQTMPYLVAYFSDNDPELAESTSLTGRSERYVMRITVHSVGQTQAAALAMSQRVRSGLLDIRPEVATRSCWPIRREEGQPVRPDETTGTETHDKVDVYRLESVPA